MPRIKPKSKETREIKETRLLMGFNLTIDEYNTGERELAGYVYQN